MTEFVSVGSANDQGELPPFERIIRVTLPNALRPNVWYAFLLQKSKLSSNSPAAIAERLIRAGAEVTKSPQRAEDFLYPYLGNPRFQIEFRNKGSLGILTNQLEPSISGNAVLSREWCTERYIVKFS